MLSSFKLEIENEAKKARLKQENIRERILVTHVDYLNFIKFLDHADDVKMIFIYFSHDRVATLTRVSAELKT